MLEVTLFSKRASSMKHCLHASRGAMVTAASVLSSSVRSALWFQICYPSFWRRQRVPRPPLGNLPHRRNINCIRTVLHSSSRSLLFFPHRRRQSSSPLHSYTRLTASYRIYSIHSINLSFSVSYSPWSCRRCPFSLSCSRSPFLTSLFLHHRSPLALLPPSLSHSHAAGRSDTSAAPELCDACQSSR